MDDMTNSSCPNTSDGHNTSKSSPDCLINSETEILSPLTIGLVLEPAIMLVVFGNLLVLISLRCHRNLIVTDVLLFSLSLADTVDGLIPLQIVIFMNYFLRKPWTKSLCDGFAAFVNTMRFASAGTVTAIAMERTFLIVSPLKYHTSVTLSKARKLVALIWLLSVFFGILPLIGVGHSGIRNQECHYQLTDLGTEYAIVIVSVSFVLLFTVLSCYVAIKISSLKFIRRQSDMVEKLATDASKLALVMGMAGGKGKKKKRNSQPVVRSQSKGVKEVQRLTIMMTIVIILYHISWLPLLINNIVILITGVESTRTRRVIFGMVSLLYALCNPFIYGKMNTRYRRGYLHVIGSVLGLCGCRPESWRISTTSQSTIRAGWRSRTESNIMASNTHQRINVTSLRDANKDNTHAQQGNAADHQKAAANTGFSEDSSSEQEAVLANGKCSEKLKIIKEEPSVTDTYL